jgi:hypothetical protein
VALGSQGQSCLCNIAVLAQLLLRERVTKVDGGKTATHATRSAAPEALTLRNKTSRRRARKTAFKMFRAAIKRPRGSHARSAQKWLHVQGRSDCDVSLSVAQRLKSICTYIPAASAETRSSAGRGGMMEHWRCESFGCGAT